MPAPYESSIVESPPLPSAEDDRDDTPTEARNDNHFSSRTDNATNNEASFQPYNPRKDSIPSHNHTGFPSPEHYPDYTAKAANHKPDPLLGNPDNPSFDFRSDPPPPPARYDSKPTLTSQRPRGAEGDLSSLPSQQRHPQSSRTKRPAGPNHTVSASSSDHYDVGGDEDRRQDAIMHMNLSRDGSKRDAHVGDSTGGLYGAYDGSGYGHAI